MDWDDRCAPAPVGDDFDPTPARVQAHCFTGSHSLPPDHVLVNADRLTMPVYVVQGRYDMIRPPVSAYELVQGLPRGEPVRALGGHGPHREGWSLLRPLLLELTQESRPDRGERRGAGSRRIGQDSRRLVGRSIADHMRTNLVDALRPSACTPRAAGAADAPASRPASVVDAALSAGSCARRSARR